MNQNRGQNRLVEGLSIYARPLQKTTPDCGVQALAHGAIGGDVIYFRELTLGIRDEPVIKNLSLVVFSLRLLLVLLSLPQKLLFDESELLIFPEQL